MTKGNHLIYSIRIKQAPLYLEGKELTVEQDKYQRLVRQYWDKLK